MLLTVLIIREILRGNTQFNRFMENIDGISPKVLTERLRELERLGIIRRRIVSEYPVRVEYTLTDVGKGFEPVLLSAASFSMKHMPRIVFKDRKPRTPDDLT
jgi:DNA-binding HxlR family transcriptional regulator